METVLIFMLGQILLNNKSIASGQLDDALLQQTRDGSKLGDILIAKGHTNYLNLYQALAKHHKLHFVDLIKEPPSSKLLDNGIPIQAFLENQAIPIKRSQEGVFTVAVSNFSDDVKTWCIKQFGDNVEFAVTSPLDIKRTIEKHFGKTIEKASRLSLWQKFPSLSARATLVLGQKQLLWATIAIMLPVLALMPLQLILFFIGFCHIAYIAMMIFKSIIFARGVPPHQPENWPENWNKKISQLDERTLPTYTILIPMYKEADSLPAMLKSMKRMDYPASKMDIKLVLEADDKETLDAAYSLKANYNFDIIRVPPNAPRTKPKACNYALRFAKGELLTIYDADDRPDPKQLKKAVISFRELPDNVMCLQARLNYYNANDNLLTRFFSLEYTILFHYMLYGLQRMGIPIPLGGTSNHMPIKHLRELGEWDPYNVTEDADLGTRLCAHGGQTRMLDSYTMEEAPNRFAPWLNQRSRWIKGYMQTWLVHMRSPKKLYSSLGARGFFGFQFFIGLSCFTFLTGPLVLLLSLIWIFSPYAANHQPFPQWLVLFTLLNLAFNLLIHWYLAVYSALQYRRHTVPMVLSALLYPLYLLLHSIASYKALYQLIVKPHFWEKTSHGLAKFIDEMSLEHDLVKIRSQK